MIITYSRRFIFLKARKTAGSSIQMVLSGAIASVNLGSFFSGVVDYHVGC